MYSNVVLGIRGERFEQLLEHAKERRGVREDTDLTADDWRALVAEFKALVREATGDDFPTDPKAQLWGAIQAVFRSWNTPRAIAYRRINSIPHDLGTAVSVCSMVFGNMGNDSGTGVCFTRDPSTGERCLYGEFLVNAQGEDVVAGIRDPLHIDGMAAALPGAYGELLEAQAKLETHYRDVQDLEFTVERGHLFLLQTRSAKRSAAAAVRSAVDMVDEGVISIEEAVLRVKPEQLDQLLHPMIDPGASVRVLTTGLPASPGAASGRVVFNPDEAAERGPHEPVILVRRETSPEDFHGMVAAQAILTARGGMTSHAAVVARGMGKCCVAGAGEVQVDEAYRRFRVGETIVHENDWITLDGSTGRVILGQVPTREPELSAHFQRLMEWADGFRTLRVRTNADTPHDSAVARRFGAEGIGLCRTEHMFFEGDRIDAVREMILAEDGAKRAIAVAKLLPMQRSDFEGIFRAMEGLPVTIRLLDPPLHEFLPQGAAETRDLARKLGLDPVRLRMRVEEHHEANPDAGAPRLPAGDQLSGHHLDAGAGDLRGRRGGAARGRGRVPGDHDPAGGDRRGAAAAARHGGRVRGRGVRAHGGRVEYTVADDDRASPRGAHGGPDRRARGVLFVRHQRPDADHLRPVPRRRGALPPVVRGDRHPPRRSVPDAGSRTASGASWRSPRSWGAA
jgi:pyruvate,orthophosphate dikinase